MDSSGLSDEVRDLIRQHISSIAQLEVLLLLFATPGTPRDPAEVARELRIDAAHAGALLADLRSRGFLDANASAQFRFQPATAALEHAVRSLEAAYHERRVAVVTLVFSKPSDPLRQFADAFRLKKGD